MFLTFINVVTGFPDSSVDRESTGNAGDLGLIPGSGRSTGEGIGYSAGRESACSTGDLGLILGLEGSLAEENRYPFE